MVCSRGTLQAGTSVWYSPDPLHALDRTHTINPAEPASCRPHAQRQLLACPIQAMGWALLVHQQLCCCRFVSECCVAHLTWGLASSSSYTLTATKLLDRLSAGTELLLDRTTPSTASWGLKLAPEIWSLLVLPSIRHAAAGR